MEERRQPHPILVEMAGDVKVIQKQMELILGNGQPGELHHIKSRLGKLEKWQWWIMGATAAVSGIAVIVAKLVIK